MPPVTPARRHLGGVVAPPRFLMFLALVAAGVPLAAAALGWRQGVMAGFDGATLVFLASYRQVVRAEPDAMRRIAARNDANRVLLLVVSAVVVLAVLGAVAAELAAKGAPRPAALLLVVPTLALAWAFSNFVYALHYAHIFYGDDDGADTGGLGFPDTPEPNYWDFVYFACCLGMCFQTSDVDVTATAMRRVVTAHCLLAFVFNLGVVAFTINVLGGA